MQRFGETADGEERDIARSYQLGVNSYLIKPVEFDQFLDIVSRAGLWWALLNQVTR